VTNNIQKFYCKNNGVLYENELIQIGVKTECRSNLARLALFFGNKTNLPFLVRREGDYPFKGGGGSVAATSPGWPFCLGTRPTSPSW
jgi:hypothetical protein